MTKLFLGAALAVASAACAPKENAADSTAVTADPMVTAAQTAKAIEANPAGADSILKAAGYTPESFQTLMFDIAADSAKSATYVAAKAR